MKGRTMAESNYMHTEIPDYHIKIGIKDNHPVDIDWSDCKSHFPKGDHQEAFKNMILEAAKILNKQSSTPPTREEQKEELKTEFLHQVYEINYTKPGTTQYRAVINKLLLMYDYVLTPQSEPPTQPTKESINEWLVKNHPLTPVAPVRMLDSDEFRRVVTDYIFEFVTGIQSDESLKIQSDFNKVSHTLDYLIEEKKRQPQPVQDYQVGGITQPVVDEANKQPKEEKSCTNCNNLINNYQCGLLRGTCNNCNHWHPKKQPDHIVDANKMIQQPEAGDKKDSIEE